VSRSLGNVIAGSLELGLGYGERLLAGVTAENFGRLANTGRSPIRSNHPAFPAEVSKVARNLLASPVGWGRMSRSDGLLC
jgi:hypothetical protein